MPLSQRALCKARRCWKQARARRAPCTQHRAHHLLAAPCDRIAGCGTAKGSPVLRKRRAALNLLHSRRRIARALEMASRQSSRCALSVGQKMPEIYKHFQGTLLKRPKRLPIWQEGQQTQVVLYGLKQLLAIPTCLWFKLSRPGADSAARCEPSGVTYYLGSFSRGGARTR